MGWLGWAGLGWAGLGWAGLGWAGLGWVQYFPAHKKHKFFLVRITKCIELK
ncbi:TPA_asm: hypothetical protein GNC36_000355 [Salmonella enterica subsp. enterica serovar Dublin]|nr:hypothetical protein [Salmonella enterica subsp. enterica serovar Dublin]